MTQKQLQVNSFDCVVLGGGMIGNFIAHRLATQFPTRRVLMIERGPLIASQHLRNAAGQNEIKVHDQHAIRTWSDVGSLRCVEMLPGIGGRSVAWTGWVPKPLDSELQGWHPEIIADLKHYFPVANRMFKAAQTPSRWRGGLHQWLRNRLTTQSQHCAVEEAPLAVDVETGFTFSGTDLLASHISLREVRPSFISGSPTLAVLSGCEVKSLIVESGRIVGVDTDLGFFSFSDRCDVLVALSAVATFALLARSFTWYPRKTELRGHVISALQAQTAEPYCGDVDFASSGYLLRGKTGDRHFHLQLTACTGSVDSRKFPLSVLFPGGTGDDLIATSRSNIIQVGVAALLEAGTTSSPLGYVDFDSQTETVSCRLDPTEQLLVDWAQMDEFTDSMLDRVGIGLHFRGKNAVLMDEKPTHSFDSDSGRRLPVLVHESSTIAFPVSDADSRAMIDEQGQVCGIDNLFVVGRATFPNVGSHNGSLLAAALALRTADCVGKRM